MNQKEERRKYPRFPVVMKNIAKPVELLFDASTTPVPSVLLDLSAVGIGLLVFVPVEVGIKINTEIDLPGLKTKVIEGKVVWTLAKDNTWRVGIAFTKIEKEDFNNISKIAEDYVNCEMKISSGPTNSKTDICKHTFVCLDKCLYKPLCTKEVKSNSNGKN